MLGFDRFVDRKDVFTVDPAGHKTANTWKKVIKMHGLSPAQVAVVGDSPRSDINPTGEIGVLHRFWIKHQETWAPHSHDANGDVTIISSLAEIADALAN